MATSSSPLPRNGFSSSVAEEKLYVWGGWTDNFSNRKRELSAIYSYDPLDEKWSLLQTKGSSPSGLVRAASTSLGHYLFFYGGDDNNLYHSEGSLHQFDTLTCAWTQLSASSIDGPRKKSGSGMVAHAHNLVLFGGRYGKDEYTNELHNFDLNERKWFSPTVTGIRPPPCRNFSLTKIDDERALLFGGLLPKRVRSAEMYILDLERMHWSKLDHPKGEPWPVERSSHVTAMLNYGQNYCQLLMTGGSQGRDYLGDMWMLDIHTWKWKEISLPREYRKKRSGHCAATFFLNPELSEVVMFGGKTSAASHALSATTVLRFEHTGLDWTLKDWCDYSSGLGNEERLKMKRDLKSSGYRYLAAYQRIIAVKSSLRMLFLKMVLVGPPGLGKTTMRRRLIGEIVDISSTDESHQCSTGTVESSQVVIRDISSTTIAVGPGNWSTVIDISEEARMFLNFFLEADKEMLKLPATASAEISILSAKDTTDGPSINSKVEEKMEVSDRRKKKWYSFLLCHSSKSRNKSEQEAEADITAPVSKAIIAKEKALLPKYAKEIYQMFMAATTSGDLEKISYSLQSTIVIKMEDTGGQPELMDMLPALVLGPSFYLLCLNLLDQLNSRYTVSYRHPSGESTPPVQSSYTVEEMLFQALSAISCFRSTPDTIVDNVEASLLPNDMKASSNSVAFIVGTHKDLVTEDQINRFDDQLQHVLTTTSFYEEGLVEFASEKRLILAVDNKSGGEEEVEKIRKFLEERIQHHFKKIQIPIAWLILSLFLRKSGLKVVSLEMVLEIATELGVSSEETKVALWFLHHHAGVLMYFPNLTELRDKVICDIQVIYDSVSYMIVHTFKFGRVKKAAQDKFKDTGQFRYEDIVMALEGLGESGDYLPLKALLELLCHLNITASIQPRSSSPSDGKQLGVVTYLMPSLLKQATEEELESVRPNNVCPMMIRFECGFVPIGVFPAMIANLVSQSSLKLITKGIKKNRVQFLFGIDYDLVTFISRPRYYEVHIVRKVEDASPRIHDVCSGVRKICENTLKNVTNCMNYTFCMKYQFSFECPLHQGEDHLCIVENPLADTMLCLKDLKAPEPVKMQREHLLWFGKDVQKKLKDEMCDGREDSRECTTSLSVPKFSLKNIRAALRDLSPRKYLDLALELNLSKISVEKHEWNWPRDTERVMTEIIQDWLDTDKSASWDTLRTALEVVQPTLAKIII